MELGLDPLAKAGLVLAMLRVLALGIIVAGDFLRDVVRDTCSSGLVLTGGIFVFLLDETCG